MKKRIDKLLRTLFIIALIGYFIIAYPNFKPFPQLTATIVSLIMFLYSGTVPVVYNNIIFVNLYNQIYQIDVSVECSGIALVLIFGIVMFITPGIKMKHRIYSLLFLPIIYMSNAIRISLSILFGQLTTVNGLLIFHSSIGQVLIFTAMISCYILFLKLFGYLKVNKNYKKYLEIE